LPIFEREGEYGRICQFLLAAVSLQIPRGGGAILCRDLLPSELAPREIFAVSDHCGKGRGTKIVLTEMLVPMGRYRLTFLMNLKLTNDVAGLDF